MFSVILEILLLLELKAHWIKKKEDVKRVKVEAKNGQVHNNCEIFYHFH